MTATGGLCDLRVDRNAARGHRTRSVAFAENYPLNMNNEGDWAALRDELGAALAAWEQK